MTTDYPSNLTYQQFLIIEPLIPPAKPGGRPRTVNILEILNGVMYRIKTGCQWEFLPKDFPPCKTVYHYYREWCLDDTWQRIHDEIVKLVRITVARKKLQVLESLTANLSKHQIREINKDMMLERRLRAENVIYWWIFGLIICLCVLEANIQDRDGAKMLLFKIKDKMSRLIKIFADAAYRGKLIDYVKNTFGWILEIVKRKEKEFKVVPFMWIVERTFAWFNNYRILSKDYEFSTKSSEGTIYIAMLHLMLRRLV
jgi:transposase